MKSSRNMYEIIDVVVKLIEYYVFLCIFLFFLFIFFVLVVCGFYFV